MTKDNSTGKNKEFYELGKRMFDRINPVKPVTEHLAQPPQRTWTGLTEDEANRLWQTTDNDDSWELIKRVEAKLKELNT